MKIPTKSVASNTFSLPVYGLGLWRMGGSAAADTSNDRRDVSAIRSAIEKGLTHFDTAEAYAEGHAEEILATALEGHDRKQFQIATKVSAQNHNYDNVLRSCENSLKRLKTDYIDLYMLHRFPPEGIPIEETMRALDKLVEEGMVRNIGVSNFTPERFEAAQKSSMNKIVCNQVHYNVQYREVEDKGLLRHAQENDYFIVAWRPVQQGVLPGSKLMDELSVKYNKTTTQVAINWLLSQKNVVTVAKTSSIEHLEENLGAIGWELEKEDIEKIRQEYPDQKKISDAVPLDY